MKRDKQIETRYREAKASELENWKNWILSDLYHK